jgi:hypothetical protein
MLPGDEKDGDPEVDDEEAVEDGSDGDKDGTEDSKAEEDS